MKISVAARRSAVMFLLLVLPAKGGEPVPLTIGEAEALALQEEPGVLAARAQSGALAERSVAADALPDPQARLGLANVPVDSFALDREAMTQTQVGLRQVFPPGGARAARSARLAASSEAMQEMAAAREREVLLQVRQAWLEARYRQAEQRIVSENVALFTDLLDVVHAGYAQGRGNQHDVLRAELELGRLEDRQNEIDAQRSAETARLVQWIGTIALERPVAESLPEWPAPEKLSIAATLEQHPLLAVLAAREEAASASVNEARSAFRPSFALDASYGFRQGVDPMGAERPDVASIMLSMDLPLFTSNRQDRELAAARHDAYAASLERERVRRDLSRQLEADWALWQSLDARVQRYEVTLLDEAQQQLDAGLTAYRNETGDFADVMRAAMMQLETQLSFERIKTDRAIAQAKLAWLGGQEQ